jgi:hypothetical protein
MIVTEEEVAVTDITDGTPPCEVIDKNRRDRVCAVPSVARVVARCPGCAILVRIFVCRESLDYLLAGECICLCCEGAVVFGGYCL